MQSLDSASPQPRQNFLSVEDFKNKPESTIDYKVGDIVTRENFNSLLMLSFSVSRGDPTLHREFLDSLEIKYGFDYKKTLQAFLDAGCWKALSEEEQFKFRDVFLTIARHFVKAPVMVGNMRSEDGGGYIKEHLDLYLSLVITGKV